MPEPLQGWFIVELLGHRRLAGMVTEQTIAGAGFLRIDVPGDEGAVATQFFSPTSVYAMTPTTEATAREVAKSSRVEPVKEWELPRPALPAAERGLRPAVFDDDNDPAVFDDDNDRDDAY